MTIRWYEDFFYGVAVDFWRMANPPERTRAEADFLERMLNLQSGDRVLDVPCGGGRHAIEIAKKGYRLTGVDIAQDCIEEARARAESESLEMELVLGNMTSLPWKSEFNGAFCLGNSFGYMDRDGTLQFLETVSETLKPGARFVLDTGMVAESILTNWEERTWMDAGDVTLLIEHQYDIQESRIDTAYTFIRNEQKETRRSSHWVFTSAQILEFLQEAGFSANLLLGSLDGEPYHVGSPLLIAVAEKE